MKNSYSLPYGPCRRFGLALFFLLAGWVPLTSASAPMVAPKPVRVAIIGLTHTHVHGMLGRSDKGDLAIVGIVEPNQELAKRYFAQYKLAPTLLYPSMTALLAKEKPEAVFAFGSIFEHLGVVEQCAPRGIHVMVEKPLAVSLAHARRMEQLARQHHVQLLTNYETTWYASNQRAFDFLNKEQSLGPLRKVVVHDGHQGLQEIGVNKEFLDWLTDPVQNGGGAVTDFGCYGVNLLTWLTKGARPLSVTALTQQIKPETYPQVDDEATLLLAYPSAQGIIQASWNWPFSRKDLEVYGKSGYAIAETGSKIRYRLAEDQPEAVEELPAKSYPYDDPYGYLAGVIRGSVTPEPYALSSLENNLIVVEILDAAIRSARTGQRIALVAPGPAKQNPNKK